METSSSHITVSSSSRSTGSHSPYSADEYSSQKCGSVITINSSNMGKMQQSWETRDKLSKDYDPNKSFSNIQKVANWIKSIEESKSKLHRKDGKRDFFEVSDSSANNQDASHKGCVVVRCDYAKPFPTESGTYKSLSGARYPEPFKKHIKKNRALALSIMPKRIQKEQHDNLKKNKCLDTDKISLISSTGPRSFTSSIKCLDGKSDISSESEMPKSIESRKKELCTYLKLMDPSDKKEIFALQNRRSTRVRNLVALQEKKELEKKIQDIPLDVNNFFQKSDKQSQDTAVSVQILEAAVIAKKAAEKELLDRCSNHLEKNGVISGKENKLSKRSNNGDKSREVRSNKQETDTSNNMENLLSGDESEAFYFPFPPKNLTEEIQNFDLVMENIVPKFRKFLSKKTEKSHILLKNSVPNNGSIKNKENVKHEEKQSKKIEKSHPQKANGSIANKTKINEHKSHSINGKLKKMNKILNNKKLRSSKFKIRFKKIPPSRDLLRTKFLKKHENHPKISKKLKKKIPEVSVQQLPEAEDKTIVQNQKPDLHVISKNPDLHVSKTPDPHVVNKNPDLHVSKTPDLHVSKTPHLHVVSKTPDLHVVSKTPDLHVESTTPDLHIVNKIPYLHLVSKNPEPETVVPSDSKISNLFTIIDNSSTINLQANSNTKNLQDIMVDMSDFDYLSEEHKKFLIENKKFLENSSAEKSAKHFFHNLEEVPPFHGFSTEDVDEMRIMCEILEQSILKETQMPTISMESINAEITHLNQISPNMEKSPSSQSFDSVSHDLSDNIQPATHLFECSEPVNTTKNVAQSRCLEINPDDVEENNCDILPYNNNIEPKSLQKSLHFMRKKNVNMSPDINMSHDWDLDESPRPKMKRLSHNIRINMENGKILKAFYVDFNLVVCQEFVVSFWMQTPLGNVLGSQDMWIPRGSTQRLVLNNKCVQKNSEEMVICSETKIAYIELWTKEHKSDIRQGPVADIFITIYFWKQRQNSIDKKVLQLENINGFAEDVQYCVMKSLSKIIVSWHVASEDSIPKRTFVHAYQLALDYQMVSHISDIEPVDHYVSSLHNIEGCENLIMGCGEKKITLWNVEYGYKVATIELSDVGVDASTLWVKCDRGFLFALQQCGVKELRLIAINGINHSWKKLASYFPPKGFERLKGVCIENGLLLSFHEKGILCWKAETGEPLEEIIMDNDLITCGSHVIFMDEDKIFVRHAIAHLLSMSADES